MTLVVDASCVVAALAGPAGAPRAAEPAGTWARERLASGPVVAPHLMPVEVAHVLRRQVVAGRLHGPAAAAALADLGDLGIELYPFEPFAGRVWQLRETVSAYDAWYVALAEAHGSPLATLDARLAAAPGPRCAFATPPGPGRQPD